MATLGALGILALVRVTDSCGLAAAFVGFSAGLSTKLCFWFLLGKHMGWGVRSEIVAFIVYVSLDDLVGGPDIQHLPNRQSVSRW